MNRRRLVNTPNDRLEIHDVERPRIEISIPANDIERMVIQHELVDSVVLLYIQGKVTLLVVRLKRQWPANVTLRVRRALYKLAEFVSISLRRAPSSGAPQ